MIIKVEHVVTPTGKWAFLVQRDIVIEKKEKEIKDDNRKSFSNS